MIPHFQIVKQYYNLLNISLLFTLPVCLNNICDSIYTSNIERVSYSYSLDIKYFTAF
jgi:hypothetical protein